MSLSAISKVQSVALEVATLNLFICKANGMLSVGMKKILDITHHSLPLISEDSLPVISVQSLPVWYFLG
jgi:hypothetical protein